MDFRVAPQAESDLDDIWYFLAIQTSSIEVADRVIDSITARFALLARQTQLMTVHHSAMLLQIHIVAGALAMILGAVALLARKGATLHRRSGQLFVCSMLTMGITASVLGPIPNGLMPVTSSSQR